MLNRIEIITKINDFAQRSIAFVFAIDFEGEKGFVMKPGEAAKEGIIFNTISFTNYTNDKQNTEKPAFSFQPPSYDEYLEAFNRVKYHLQRGDTYLINLTFPSRIETTASLEDLFHASHARYKLMVPENFIVFSPETFISTRQGKLYTYPMKGTIDAGIPNAAGIILSSSKEKFEHNTIVDLLRNDLSMVAGDVKVEEFRYIEKITTNKNELLQLSSRIAGNLPHDFKNRLGDIIFTLLPAGSVTGAPKERTVHILNETENYKRGFYTGVFGYFDGTELDTAVMIRFIEQMGESLYYKSGGGITTLSDPREEYDELIKKIYVPVI